MALQGFIDLKPGHKEGCGSTCLKISTVLVIESEEEMEKGLKALEDVI